MVASVIDSETFEKLASGVTTILIDSSIAASNRAVKGRTS